MIDEEQIIEAMGDWRETPPAFFVPDDEAELYPPMPDCLSQALLIASCDEGEAGTPGDDIERIALKFRDDFRTLSVLRAVLCGACKLSWDTEKETVNMTLITDPDEIHLRKRAIFAQAGVRLA
jgi:hypothetical protein